MKSKLFIRWHSLSASTFVCHWFSTLFIASKPKYKVSFFPRNRMQTHTHPKSLFIFYVFIHVTVDTNIWQTCWTCQINLSTWKIEFFWLPRISTRIEFISDLIVSFTWIDYCSGLSDQQIKKKQQTIFYLSHTIR